jgi:hypothetical protein
MEISISEAFRDTAPYVGIVVLLIGFYFAWRSFYKMRAIE